MLQPRAPKYPPSRRHPRKTTCTTWTNFWRILCFPSWVQLKFFLWNVISFRTSELRQCFLWLLRFDFVLSWNSLFVGPLVVVHCTFVQVSRLKIERIKPAGWKLRQILWGFHPLFVRFKNAFGWRDTCGLTPWPSSRRSDGNRLFSDWSCHPGMRLAVCKIGSVPK
jgi:hypothetical protein